MIREDIDIEALLVRAYREKRVDRLGGGTDPEWRERAWSLILLAGPGGGGGGGIGGLGVQTSSYATMMAARQSRGWAMLDAGSVTSLDVLHDAVLALPTFYVERIGELEFEVWDADTALRLGNRIGAENGAAYVERVRRRGGQDAKRADELRVCGPRRPVTPIVATNLMIHHGRAADRPAVPDVVVTGRRPILKGRQKEAAGHEPVYETPLGQVVEARAIYATWYACLGILRAAVEGSPVLDVTGPLAPAAPWEDAPVPAPGAVRGTRSGRRATGKSDVSATA